MTANIWNSKLYDQTIPSGRIVVLGTGQSNMANWSSATFSTAGETAFLSTLNANNTVGRNVFINSGDGSSWLSKKAYDYYAKNVGTDGLDTDDWWWDDTVTPNKPGPRLLDALADLEANGIPINIITNLLWSQGESDVLTLQRLSDEFTQTDYYNALVNLKDFFFARFTALRRMHIRPLGRRTIVGGSGDSAFRWYLIRQAQQLLAANYPEVVYGSETYDLEMRSEMSSGADLGDGVHRSPAGYTIEGTRAAKEVLYYSGQYTGNTKGAYISGVNYTGGVIIVTVTHDKGTKLANKAGTAYNGTPIDITPNASKYAPFNLFTADGVAIPITSVFITGNSQITITPSITLTSADNVLQYCYNSMDGNADATVNLDLNAIPYDNHADNPLPLRSTYSATVSGSLSAIESMSNLVSFFSPEVTYNAGGTASDAVVWTKRAGSGGSARKDDAKPAPTYYSDISTVITGAAAIAGWYFNGTSQKKLLVDNALTSSSSYTVFVVATPNTNATDATPASPVTNAIITTGGTTGSDNNLFSIYQSATALGNRGALITDQGTTAFASLAGAKTGVAVIKRSGSSASIYDETGFIISKTISATPVIDSDGGTPVYALGNAVDKTTGVETNSAFYGAIHYVIVFSTALSDAQIADITAALKTANGIA